MNVSVMNSAQTALRVEVVTPDDSAPMLVQNQALAPIVSTNRTLGSVVALPTADTDVVTTIPANAVSFLLWFETETGMVKGRYALRSTSTVITVSESNMGYLPAFPSSHFIPADVSHLHVAGIDADTTCYVTWLFAG